MKGLRDRYLSLAIMQPPSPVRLFTQSIKLDVVVGAIPSARIEQFVEILLYHRPDDLAVYLPIRMCQSIANPENP